MANDLNVDVSEKSVERTIRALKTGIREGAYESVKWGAKDYEDTAKDTIRGRRMWNREVYHGFRRNAQRQRKGAWGSVTNPVPHAVIVNYGRRPGARAPQVQHIIEWVDDKIFAAMIADGGFNPNASDDRDHAVTDRDSDVEAIEPLAADPDADTDTANSKSLKRVYFENGESGIFSPHEGIISDFGSTYNEVGYHRVLEELGLREDIVESYPDAKLWQLTYDTGKTENGMMMAWSEEGAGRPIGNHLVSYMNPMNFRHSSDWLDEEDHRKFVARTGVMDYLFGNDDRHYGNVLYGKGGRPIAIDNGGNAKPGVVVDSNTHRKKMLTVLDVTVMPNTKDLDGNYVIYDPERLRTHMHDVWDRQEAIFQQLSNDRALREALVAQMQNIHPENSEWYDFFERAWLDEDGWRYTYFVEQEEWGNRELWQYDLDKIRNKFESDYQDRINDDPAITNLHDSDDTTSDVLDDVIGTPDSGILGEIHDEFDNA